MAFPSELSALKQFVVWKMEPREIGGKPTKVPYNARTGGKASASETATWGTFDEAVKAMQTGNYTGIGFEFAPPYTGIDLDNCRDANTGKIEDWAADLIKDFYSYTEISPSGCGVHIFVKGKLPGPGLNRTVDGHKIEMYDTGRFFTLTGEHLEATPVVIEERNEPIQMLYSWVVQQTANNQTGENQTPVERPNLSMSDEDVLTKCRAAKNAEKFNRLWAGDFSAYGNGDHSAADLALCSIMGFYTQDTDQIDRLFRNSGLNRQKWERTDYRDRTIREALNKSEFYTPPNTTKIYFGNGKQIDQSDQSPDVDINCTDVGNGIRLARNFGRDLHYSYIWKKWMVWDGRRWKIDDDAGVETRAKETAKQVLGEALAETDTDRRGRLAKWAIASESSNRIKSMIEMCQSEPGIAVDPDELDKNQYLLNVKNGTLNLLTGELYEPRHSDLITRFAPVDYDPSASCPAFEKYLQTIFAGNNEIIGFVQKAIGYSLTGDTCEQKMLVCYGTGANGKSTLIELIGDLLGEYGTTIPTESLLHRPNTGGIPNDIAKLRGSRFVSSVEVDEGRRLSESLVKQLTGGDMVTARFMRAEFFDFKPTFKLWMAVNHRPVINGIDNGIWRRICLVPFNVTIPDEEQDKNLPVKLRAELSGVLNWALDGCLAWKRWGLGVAEAVTTATAEYRSEMDRLGPFIEERCNIGDIFEVSASVLFQAYRKWAEDNGIRNPMDSKKLRAAMLDKGFGHKKTKYANIFTKIALLNESNW